MMTYQHFVNFKEPVYRFTFQHKHKFSCYNTSSKINQHSFFHDYLQHSFFMSIFNANSPTIKRLLKKIKQQIFSSLYFNINSLTTERLLKKINQHFVSQASVSTQILLLLKDFLKKLTNTSFHISDAPF